MQGTTSNQNISSSLSIGPFHIKRLVVAVILLCVMMFPNEFGEITRGLMIDAYVQVSAFVAATLLLFYGAERLFKFDIGSALRNARNFQIPLAALLGATPGCGGAVIVIAAYTSGNVGFGAVVATLTATMGDAAFLIIAVRPDVAIVLLPLSFAAGIVSGFIIDRFVKTEYRTAKGAACEIPHSINQTRARDYLFVAFAAPGLIIGIAQLLQKDINEIFGLSVPIIALAGTVIGILIWAASPVKAMTNPKDHPFTRATEETSFISIWVIGAYLAYDYFLLFTGLNLETLFASVAPLLPLMGVLVGLIPGCGPQVLVATLYINGLIPFSALLGNAISNDGDALFPAIALNPKAAIAATLYSTIPALILAYGFYFFAPNVFIGN